MADDDQPEDDAIDSEPKAHDLPEEVLENLKEVAPLPAPIPEPGPL
ncbi:hypothetical protein IB229_17585 [Pseudomonas sp. PDM14]|nr:hypothetical protein [Pseudomonas sp. PDM14]MBD9484798.1 hypothetical protein [Pseudomonas sp. PDM14]